VHREIKQNRKKATVGGVEPNALADQAAPQNYRGDLAQGSIREMSGYGRTAHGARSGRPLGRRVAQEPIVLQKSLNALRLNFR
jgi:hypothetical protein